jgi:hypothetical protein
MEKQLSNLIAAIFHPMLFPTYYVLIVLNLQFSFSLMIPDKSKWSVVALVFISTFLVPMLITEVLGWKIKRTVFEKRSNKRILLLITAMIFYFMTYYLLIKLQLSPIFTIFILGSTSLLFMMLIISAFWTISAYMVATGALFGAFLCMAVILKTDMILLLITLIFLSGFIGYSRMKTTIHSPLQIYSGFFLGAGTMYLHFLYF